MHVMLDLETMGTRPGCVVRSIGAVAFHLTGEILDEFYCNIDWASCVLAGLTVDNKTVEWWARQSEHARASLDRDAIPLLEACRAFHAWCRKVGLTRVWGHGANFDPPVWEAACLAAGVSVPWKYSQVRDTRTMFDLCGYDFSGFAREGTHHHALDDARNQARYLAKAWQGSLANARC